MIKSQENQGGNQAEEGLALGTVRRRAGSQRTNQKESRPHQLKHLVVTPSPSFRSSSLKPQSAIVMAAATSPVRERRGHRPSTNTRHPTAPSIMSVNGHFANVGEKPTKEQYEHGIQVINEDQEFKYVLPLNTANEPLLTGLFLALPFPITSPSRKFLQRASITI